MSEREALRSRFIIIPRNCGVNHRESTPIRNIEEDRHNTAMNLFIYPLLFSLFLVPVLGGFKDDFQDEGALSLGDFFHYLQAENVGLQKRNHRYLGPCRAPNGKMCNVCNLKITNPKDRRRYLKCPKGGK